MRSEADAQAAWVRAWYAAPSRRLSADVSGRTFRQVVHLHAGGKQVRLQLSNRYGQAPVRLRSVSVARVLQGPVVSPGACVVRFAGHESVTLRPGEELVSDPVALPVEAFSNVAVTFFLTEGEILTGHAYAQQTSYLSGLGDVTAAGAEASVLLYPLLTTSWWLITGIDVLPDAPLNAVIAFGSSTTDGVGSTVDANRRWPDHLARRLRDAGGTRFMSVVNAGIGGNQLTTSERPWCGGAGIPPFLSGEAGKQRLAWDALAQTGATDLIVNIGSNDLRFGVAGASVIEAYQRLAKQARKTYRRVFGSTIMPGSYPPEQVVQRQLVNTWLREQGTNCFDAVFDFAMPLRAPDDEAKLHPAYDCGDATHPNDEGYRRVADAVDISLLTGSPCPTA